jgi:hypothetical protein
MKIKTSELTGPALDWAVAKAQGKRPSLFIYQQTGALAKEHNYSSDWSQGGPIIERERMQIAPLPDKGWRGHWRSFNSADRREVWMDCFDEGITPLIAAMRCYVASKLGDTVDVPEELV